MAGVTTYTAQIGDEICDRIVNGESIRSISQDKSMPSPSTIFKWISEIPEFSDKYAHAKEAQADYFAEELLDIADDGSNDWMTKRFGETEVEIPNPEVLQRSKLRVDTRKWLMSKFKPKRFGDKVQHTGEDGGPISFTVTRAGSKEK